MCAMVCFQASVRTLCWSRNFGIVEYDASHVDNISMEDFFFYRKRHEALFSDSESVFLDMVGDSSYLATGAGNEVVHVVDNCVFDGMFVSADVRGHFMLLEYILEMLLHPLQVLGLAHMNC